MTDRPTSQAPGGDPASTPDLDRYVADFGTTFVAATERAGDAAGAISGRRSPGDAALDATREARSWRRPFALTRGRIAGVSAATLAAVVAGVVLLPLAPAPAPLSKSLDVVAEARAALGERGEIVHYVTRTTSETRGFKPTEPSRCKPQDAVEVWQATTGGPKWKRVSPGMDPKCGVMSRGDGTQLKGEEQFARSATESVEYYPELGRVFVTTELSPTGRAAFLGLPQLDAPEKYQDADAVSALRRMLQDGYLRNGGAWVRKGRKVFRLMGLTRTTTGKGADTFTATSRMNYIVDAETFVPIELQTSRESQFLSLNRQPGKGMPVEVMTTTFLTYETLPRTPENEALLTIQPKGPVTTETTTAAQFGADARARMKKESAEGRANAKRINAERKRREAAATP